MSIVDWIITLVPMAFVVWTGFYSRRFIKGVSDYLAAGRVAGRYVLCVSGVAEGLAVITLIGYTEAHYKTGFAMAFWNNILAPLSIFIGLTGFVSYRFRETRVMSVGQFLEMRYNRALRFYASALRSVAELLANCMCPALAARFMIYYMGLPHSFKLLGVEIPSFLILTLIMITLCVLICYLGGTLSLLVTDTIQGFICYPMLIIFTIFIICKFSWNDVVIPAMSDRVAGQSFLNPYDISHLRDFNMFALVVTVYSTIVNRANWLGTGSNVAARTPHEQKMAGIMGTWRGMFSSVLYVLMVIMVISMLNHPSLAVDAKEIRDNLSERVLGEVPVETPQLRKKLIADVKKLPPRDHVIGGKRPQDARLSHDSNLDTPHLEAVHKGLKGSKNAEANYQQFFTLYHQMMLPVTLRHILPAGMLGLFALFVLLMMLSTDDSRLFSAAQTIAQDCVVPFMKKGFSTETHVLIIRLVTVGCGLFWFIGSFFMAQLDYVNMFVTIMCTLWIGAGPMMIFGLYSRFGNTTGAFSSLISGMVLSLFFIFCQRNWADLVYPWLEANELHIPVGEFLATCSAPFEPWIVWRMAAHKFPINSMEINFIIMLSSLFFYIAGSLITYKGPFNLDRMLHRGIYNTGDDKQPPFRWSFRNAFKKIIGITPEYSTGDKAISWSVFIYSFIYKFLITFVLVVLWNIFSPWKLAWWGHYFFVVYLGVPLVSAFVTSIWFFVGGVIDIRRLFRDLAARVDNPLDNGQVEGNVALSDVAAFSELRKEEREEPKDSGK
ncbi:MAG: sodium:panthothenate symporter [Lentisphaeria bacterium]|nr:sodium:panthothenate symporter [Lentisphaeria bacterium]